jgi:hypothetical protein
MLLLWPLWAWLTQTMTLACLSSCHRHSLTMGKDPPYCVESMYVDVVLCLLDMQTCLGCEGFSHCFP